MIRAYVFLQMAALDQQRKSSLDSKNVYGAGAYFSLKRVLTHARRSFATAVGPFLPFERAKPIAAAVRFALLTAHLLWDLGALRFLKAGNPPMLGYPSRT